MTALALHGVRDLRSLAKSAADHSLQGFGAWLRPSESEDLLQTLWDTGWRISGLVGDANGRFPGTPQPGSDGARCLCCGGFHRYVWFVAGTRYAWWVAGERYAWWLEGEELDGQTGWRPWKSGLYDTAEDAERARVELPETKRAAAMVGWVGYRSSVLFDGPEQAETRATALMRDPAMFNVGACGGKVPVNKGPFPTPQDAGKVMYELGEDPLHQVAVEMRRPASAYDPSVGPSFSTYATRLLRLRVVDWYRDRYHDTRYGDQLVEESLEGILEEQERDGIIEVSEEGFSRDDVLTGLIGSDVAEETLVRQATGTPDQMTSRLLAEQSEAAALETVPKRKQARERPDIDLFALVKAGVRAAGTGSLSDRLREEQAASERLAA